MRPVALFDIYFFKFPIYYLGWKGVGEVVVGGDDSTIEFDSSSLE